ncbi:MAG: hypothetical protein ACR2KS_10175 [Candidatus Eremiobacter antarcticus]|nr:hypothetical protein [Candidatus Eremiobacteraeota bacterium]MBC5808799.1 hypothetical protein [Candidatus Eremiobacteraeota bacterium]
MAKNVRFKNKAGKKFPAAKGAAVKRSIPRGNTRSRVADRSRRPEFEGDGE